MTTTTEARFWSKVQTGPSCWEWQGTKNADGYGRFRGQLAHRMAYEMTVGLIPEGLSVCHHCDHPACVRPNHLYVGTHADNVRDMIAKGRGRNQRKTHCTHGHLFDEANTLLLGRGERACRACHRKRQRERYARMRQEVSRG